MAFQFTQSNVTKVLTSACAVLFLNAALSMTNWWPTPFVWFDARIAPEFVYAWVGLLVWIAWRGQPSRAVISLFAVLYCGLILGRYLDTTAPALFGRPIHLYWDGLQIPRLLLTSLRNYPIWISAGIVLVLVVLIGSIFLAIRWAWTRAAREIAPYVLRSRLALALTAFGLVSSVANLFGATSTWPYVSRPVIPTYLRQAVLMTAIVSGRAQANVLPPARAFTSDLKTLNNADLHLFFIESYGAIAFDNQKLLSDLSAGRALFQRAIDDSGKQVVSAFIGSTTFAGGSELAHVALQTGVDTSDPMRHDVIITTDRPTLSRYFQQLGYDTFGIYPGLSWDWQEKSFYGFGTFVDGRAFNYKGPNLGYWKIPDQVALARFAAQFPIAKNAKPRMLFYLSVASHFPFHPVPPYEPNWSRMLTDTPFDPAIVTPLLESKTNWLDMMPGYTGMMRYNYQWLAGYLREPHSRDFVLIALGDHQPPANISGEGASWDVPVHIVASNQALLERFIAQGFTPGLIPKRERLTTMNGLTDVLLNAFDGKPIPDRSRNLTAPTK
jgi:Sulfatase